MFSPSGGGQLVLQVGGAGVSGQGFGCQQQLTGGHGDGLQVGHHLGLVFFRLEEGGRRGLQELEQREASKCH